MSRSESSGAPGSTADSPAALASSVYLRKYLSFSIRSASSSVWRFLSELVKSHSRLDRYWGWPSRVLTRNCSLDLPSRLAMFCSECWSLAMSVWFSDLSWAIWASRNACWCSVRFSSCSFCMSRLRSTRILSFSSCSAWFCCLSLSGERTDGGVALVELGLEVPDDFHFGGGGVLLLENVFWVRQARLLMEYAWGACLWKALGSGAGSSGVSCGTLALYWTVWGRNASGMALISDETIWPASSSAFGSKVDLR